VLDPVADRLEKLGLNRLAASLLIVGGFVVAVVVAGVLVAPVLGRQFAELMQSLPGYVERLQSLATEAAATLAQKYGGGWMNDVGLGQGGGAEIQKAAGGFVGEGVQWGGRFIQSVWSGGQAVLGVVSLMVVTPVVTFYLLLDWARMLAVVNEAIPPRYRDTVHAVAGEIDGALAGFLRGQSLVCLFLGLWYGTGLTLIGLNFGFLIGLTAGLLSFIPYVGSLTALILSVVVALVQGWPSAKLLVMALGVVFSGQFLEGNVLSPKLVGGSVGLHPVWLMFALLAFGSVMGFTGLILAVPMAATIGVVVRFAAARYRSSGLYVGESVEV
jgi:predicted PurR-regulated permease PerM